MSDSLRDQLLGLGFKPAPKPERKPERKPPHAGKPQHAGKPTHAAKPQHGKPPHKGGGKPQPKSREDIDLAKAYAIRAQKEKD